jgi:hypothetical protein
MFDITTLDPNKVTAEPLKTPGTKFIKWAIVSLDGIYVPPMSLNAARKKGKDRNNIEKLTQSLQRAIQYDKMPPIIRKCNRIIDGKQYFYELICGHHRMEALEKNGYDFWIFAIYELPVDGVSYEDAIRTLQLVENDHSPALESSHEDIANIIARLIANGSNLVENNEDSIRDYVETYCQNKLWQTKAKIVRQAVNLTGAYQDVVTYTASDAFKWLDDNTSFTYAGNYDANNRAYGWTVLEGYEQEYIMNAIKKYAETGRESYFICHTKPPTEKMDLEDKRASMLQSFKTIENNLKEVIHYYNKNGKFPWQTKGFLPQDHKAEEKYFIEI